MSVNRLSVRYIVLFKQAVRVILEIKDDRTECPGSVLDLIRPRIRTMDVRESRR